MKNEKGFSLTETVLIMVIVGVLSLITIPVIMDAIEAIRLNGAVNKLMVDIRYVRELALGQHKVHGIELSTATNSYTLFSWDGSSKTTLTNPYKGGNMTFDFDTASEFSGVSIDFLDVCEGALCTTNEIRISSFGVPSDSLDTVFTGVAQIRLALGSSTRTIQMTPETGFVEVI